MRFLVDPSGDRNVLSASRNSSVTRAGFAERHRAVKARSAAGVAGAGAQLLDLRARAHPGRNRPAISIDALDVAGTLALLPKRLARAAVIPGLAALDGFREAPRVHVRDHQHVAGSGVGDDRGDQSVAVKFRREGEAFFYVVRG